MLNQDKHKQVCVKVNAYVDEKIAPIVEAMSNLPNIVTKYSCEDWYDRGNTNHEITIAYISFRFRDEYSNWQELGRICDMLSKGLAGGCRPEFFVRWNEGMPVGVLEFNVEDTNRLALAMHEFLCGTGHIKSGN
jgi:hypothetical protein